MKLEFKHFTPYLPYGLRFGFTKDYYYPYPNMQKKGFLFTFDLFQSPNIIYCSNTNKNWTDVVINQDYFKPALRPLSDLTKEIEVNGEKFVPIEVLRKEYSGFWFEYNSNLLIKSKNTNLYISLNWVIEINQKLYEWHFDVFGLIENGLAIDINTLES